MSAILLSAHVIVAILAVGPIAVAASMFPRYAGDAAAIGPTARIATMTWALSRMADIGLHARGDRQI